MSTDDLFASLGDSFQLAEDDGNLSVGSFDQHGDNLDFSSELVFGDDPSQQQDDTRAQHKLPSVEEMSQQLQQQQGGGITNNNTNQASMSSLTGGNSGLAAALPAPPSMTMSASSLNNNNSGNNLSFNNSFRAGGGATTISSSALQNAAATIQGAPQFSFAQNQQQQNMSNQMQSNSFMQPPQQQQQFQQNSFMSNATSGMNNSMNRSSSINNAMMSNNNSMNRNAVMNNAMMSNNNPMNRNAVLNNAMMSNNNSMNRSSSMNNAMMSNNNSNNSGSMGNATFNSAMPPPSRSPMTTNSISSNNMFSSFGNQPNQFFGQQQQQQQPNATGSNWNCEQNKPSRPLSAYEFFVQERKRLGALSDAQLQVIWKEQLDGRQKEIYLQQARADRQRYISELKLWKARSERNQPAGAVGNFLKARLQGSKTDLVEANKRGRLQPAIVSCPNLNVSPGLRLQAMQQQQQQFQGGGQQNATFDNFQVGMNQQPQGSRPRSRFVANQMQRLQQGQGLADLASELGQDGTTSFVSAMMPRSQSAGVVQSGMRFKNQSTPNMHQDPMMDPLMEFPGF